VATLGASRFDPDPAGMDSETWFSFGFGGGLKFFPRSRIGLRLDTRVLGSLSDDNQLICQTGGITGNGCTFHSSGSILWQYVVNAGMIVRF
jgi:hypothetical protein